MVRGGVAVVFEQSCRLRDGPAWPRECKGGRRAGVSAARRLHPAPDEDRWGIVLKGDGAFLDDFETIGEASATVLQLVASRAG